MWGGDKDDKQSNVVRVYNIKTEIWISNDVAPLPTTTSFTSQLPQTPTQHISDTADPDTSSNETRLVAIIITGILIAIILTAISVYLGITKRMKNDIRDASPGESSDTQGRVGSSTTAISNGSSRRHDPSDSGPNFTGASSDLYARRKWYVPGLLSWLYRKTEWSTTTKTPTCNRGARRSEKSKKALLKYSFLSKHLHTMVAQRFATMHNEKRKVVNPSGTMTV